jgi:hypothetical protein
MVSVSLACRHSVDIREKTEAKTTFLTQATGHLTDGQSEGGNPEGQRALRDILPVFSLFPSI